MKLSRPDLTQQTIVKQEKGSIKFLYNSESCSDYQRAGWCVADVRGMVISANRDFKSRLAPVRVHKRHFYRKVMMPL